MEGLVLHGAAHLFFENKLGELEAHINGKFKKIEMKLEKKMYAIFQHQSQQIKNLNMDIAEIREDLREDFIKKETRPKVYRLQYPKALTYHNLFVLQIMIQYADFTLGH